MACSRKERMESLIAEIGNITDKQYQDMDMYINEKVFPEYVLHKKMDALKSAMGGTLEQRIAFARQFIPNANGNTFSPMVSAVVLAKSGKLESDGTKRQKEVYQAMVEGLTNRTKAKPPQPEKVDTIDPSANEEVVIDDTTIPPRDDAPIDTNVEQTVGEVLNEEATTKKNAIRNEPIEVRAVGFFGELQDSTGKYIVDDITKENIYLEDGVFVSYVSADKAVAIENQSTYRVVDEFSTKGSTIADDGRSTNTVSHLGIDVQGIYSTLSDLVEQDVDDGHNVDLETFQKMAGRLGEMLTTLHGINEDFKLDLHIHDTDGQTRGNFTSIKDSVVGDKGASIDVFRNPNDKSTPASSILLHEMFHAFAKGAIKQNPQLAKDAKDLRDKLRESGTVTVDTFLQGYVDAGVQISADILEKAQIKFEYVMNDFSDIEEFMAYALSDSNFEKAVSKADSLESLDQTTRENTRDRLASKSSISLKVYNLTSMVRAIVRAIRSLFNFNSNADKSGDDIVNELIQSISDTHNNTLTSSDKSGISLLGFDVISQIVSDSFPRTIKTTKQVYEAFEKYGYKPSKKGIEKGYSYLFKTSKTALKKAKEGAIGDAIAFTASLPIIKDALDTRIVKDLYRQLFQDTAEGSFSKFYDLHRNVKLLNEKVINDQHVAISEEIAKNQLGTIGNTVHMQNYTEAVFSTGLVMVVDKLDGVPTKDNVEKLRELYRQQFLDNFGNRPDIGAFVLNFIKFKRDGDNKLIDDSLARFNLDDNERVFITELLGIQSFINLNEDVKDMVYDTFDLKSYKKRNDLSVSEAKVKLQAFRKELNSITNVYSEEFRDTIKALPNTSLDSFTTGITKDTVIKYIHEDEAVDGIPRGAKMLGETLEEDSIKIGKDKYYRVAFTNGSVGFDDGLFNVVGFKKDGLSVGSMIRLSLLKKHNNNSTEASKEFKDALELFELGADISEYVKTDKPMIAKRDFNGNIIDIVINNTLQDTLALKGNTDYIGRISTTISRMKSRKLGEAQNTKVIKLLDIAYKASVNKKSKQYKNTKFLEVSPTKNVKLWESLTDTIREQIKQRTPLVDGRGKTKRDTIFVPDDMVELVFGTRTASLSNLTLFNVSLGLIKNRKELFESESAKRLVVQAENAVKTIFGEIKTATVLFNSAVFLQNIISNMHITWSYGIDPITYMVQFTKGWKQLQEYEKMNKELIRLKVFNPEQKSVIKALESKISDSDVHGLVRDGQFTPMVDGYDADDDGRISGFFADKFAYNANVEYDSKLERQIAIEGYNRAMESDAPIKNHRRHEDDVREEYKARGKGLVGQKTKAVLFNVYGASGTPVHKVAQQAVLYGDALTKLMIIKKQKAEGKLDTPTKNKAFLRKLDSQFVNYSYNDSPLMSWAEKVGGLHFVKYFLRHAKGYAKVVNDNPTSVIAQQGFEGFTDWDFSDPTDTHLDHSFTDNIINREQALKPLETIYDLINPNLTELV